MRHSTSANTRSPYNGQRYQKAKLELIEANTEAVMNWLASQGSILLSTSFGTHSSVLLRLAVQKKPDIPVVWVDTGYNTEHTYRYVDQLTELLDLNLSIYHPRKSVKHREATGNKKETGATTLSDFTEEVKLEPFRRALRDHAPDFWITGIRREETEYRNTLEIVSKGPENIVKIAPLLEWTEKQLDAYMAEHKLPSLPDYYDPTKGAMDRECGLHCSL